ncbi:MAG TPA: TadG family pilus assembly protein [Methylophilaceae bacterium]|nr:TadG family pilus assembly protein [Methylophilaceae bacterium]
MFNPSINSPRKQRGIIGLWGAMTLLLAVLFMALAVDTGRLWMQKRKLQSIADVASIEAASLISCEVNIDAVRDAAQNAAARNGYNGQLSQSPNLIQLGSITNSSGIRQFFDTSDDGAVRIYITQTVPASLVAGGLFGNQVLLHAEAVSAAHPPMISFTAGSFLLNINSSNEGLMDELLGGLLGTNINLSLLSYQGLATADVTLADMLRVQGSSSVQDLLNAEMSLRDLINLIGDGVAEAGTANSPAATALQQLGAAVAKGATIRLSDILAVSAPNEEVTADFSLNALSLITAAALFVNEGASVSLGVLDATITVTQAPVLAIGPSDGTGCTEAKTAQLRVNTSVSLGVANVSLQLAVAQGSARFNELTTNGSQSRVKILATPGVASLDIAATVLGLPVPINLPSLASSPQELVFEVAHPVKANLPQTMTATTSAGDSLSNVLQGTGAPAAVSSLLEAIGNQLLDPLLELLGIRLGGIDVTLHDIQWRQPKPLII